MNEGWNISAIFYELSYSKLMHDIDGYTIGFLANAGKLKGSRILDAGAGTGNIDFKLVDAGADKVVAVENNPAMLWRLNSKRKKKQEYEDKIHIVDKDMYEGVFDEIANGRFDVQLFRRCLYGSEDKVKHLLSQSYENLSDDGIIFIVHPEADKEKYFDNGFGGVALSHVLKWHISNFGSKTMIDYKRYTQGQLEALCKESCPDSLIEFYSPIRPAYNILTISKR